jgi:hypothetical protein
VRSVGLGQQSPAPVQPVKCFYFVPSASSGQAYARRLNGRGGGSLAAESAEYCGGGGTEDEVENSGNCGQNQAGTDMVGVGPSESVS